MNIQPARGLAVHFDDVERRSFVMTPVVSCLKFELAPQKLAALFGVETEGGGFFFARTGV